MREWTFEKQDRLSTWSLTRSIVWTPSPPVFPPPRLVYLCRRTHYGRVALNDLIIQESCNRVFHMSTSLSPSSATPSSAERTSTKDLSLLSQYARSPYGAWTASFLRSLNSNSPKENKNHYADSNGGNWTIVLAAVPPTVKLSTGYPHLVSLPVFAAIFAGTGLVLFSLPFPSPRFSF